MDPYVDYTLLRPEATTADFENLCREALDNLDVVRSVCILPDPEIVDLCRNILGSTLKICIVIDFPLGRGGLYVKTERAFAAQVWEVDEIDTVLDMRLFREGRHRDIREELQSVVSYFPSATKVILETGHSWYTEYSIEHRIKMATKLVAHCGVFCVKTSTGVIANIPIEKKVEHVRLMHEAAPHLMIKVAGGVKTMAHVNLFRDVVPVEKLIIGASSMFWK
jgi:deoxyribose-phosphate aldolase